MGASGCVWSCTARIQGKVFVELVQTCDKEKLPILVGGDFNIIRSPSEKTIISSMQGGLFCLTQSLMA